MWCFQLFKNLFWPPACYVNLCKCHLMSIWWRSNQLFERLQLTWTVGCRFCLCGLHGWKNCRRSLLSGLKHLQRMTSWFHQNKHSRHICHRFSAPPHVMLTSEHEVICAHWPVLLPYWGTTYVNAKAAANGRQRCRFLTFRAFSCSWWVYSLFHSLWKERHISIYWGCKWFSTAASMRETLQ